MPQTPTLAERLEKLNKMANRTDQVFDLGATQKTAIQHFCADLLQDYTSQDSDVRKDVADKLSQYSDMIKVAYKRDTLWEKLTLSKKHPEVKLLADEKQIFDKLYADDQSFRSQFDKVVDKAMSSFTSAWQEQKNQKRIPQQREGQEFDAEGNFDASTLLLVHVTDFLPEKDADGCYVIKPLFNATKSADVTNPFPRGTLHFALNHHVKSHANGAWDDKPYVILAPLKETIQKNGQPVCVDSNDTYFEFGVDENMHLPTSAHLVEPAVDKQLPVGCWSATVGNRTIYKCSHFTQKEIDSLLTNRTRDAFSQLTTQQEKDRFLASLVKQQVVSNWISSHGYTTKINRETTPDAHMDDERILGMIKKMGLQGGRDDWHWNTALATNNFCDNLGAFIGSVYRCVMAHQMVLAAKKVEIQGEDTFVDGKRLETDLKYDAGKLQDMVNLRHYLVQFCLTESLEKDKANAAITSGVYQVGCEQRIAKVEQIRKQNLPFEESFFKQYEALFQKTYTPKEREVFMAWVDEEQARIDKIVGKLRGKTFDQALQEKMVGAQPRTTKEPLPEARGQLFQPAKPSDAAKRESGKPAVERGTEQR